MYLCLLLPEGNYFKQTSTQPVGDQKGQRAKESKQSQGYRGRHLKWWGQAQEEGFSLQNDGFVSKT